jgi:hypothetical protein
MRDYEEIAKRMPAGRERTERFLKYWSIKQDAGRELRRQAEWYRNQAACMGNPGEPNGLYDGLTKQQILEKSWQLVVQAKQKEYDAIAAYEEKKLFETQPEQQRKIQEQQRTAEIERMNKLAKKFGRIGVFCWRYLGAGDLKLNAER